MHVVIATDRNLNLGSDHGHAAPDGTNVRLHVSITILKRSATERTHIGSNHPVN